ncbi:putative phosphoribosyl-ATPpyrophosphohydrolase [Rhodococcus phage E3]|uniref:MazG-like pyrophosphatase n=1 Tax=Rhodococcus phage E3 TaxID=1007869 RepID=UPI0002C6A310|nr:MazG-like pyrophosphatase [Rhodococcus phage E3]AEQ21096.1 putative phosphoribosyl-ATPpyrophosphohydrolase [Rhodococcus phage E3]
MPEYPRTDLLSATDTFLEAADHPFPEVPSAPSVELFASRLAMITEEFRELFASVGLTPLDVAFAASITDHDQLTEQLALQLEGQQIDLAEAVDAFDDIIVVAHGGAREIAGPATNEAAWEVARANLDKIVDGKVVRTPKGKITKPEGHRAADVESVLRRYGMDQRHDVLVRTDMPVAEEASK